VGPALTLPARRMTLFHMVAYYVIVDLKQPVKFSVTSSNLPSPDAFVIDTFEGRADLSPQELAGIAEQRNGPLRLVYSDGPGESYPANPAGLQEGLDYGGARLALRLVTSQNTLIKDWATRR
jgi:hypothetical protein